jgi:hypothetical protein
MIKMIITTIGFIGSILGFVMLSGWFLWVIKGKH